MRPYQVTDFVGTPTAGPYVVTGAFPLTILGWVATARDNDTANPATTPGTIFNTATRTSSECYIRGLREELEYRTSSGLPWQHRRIVFMFQGFDILNFNGTVFPMWVENTNGFVRSMHSLTSSNPAAVGVFDQLQTLLFEGRLGVDWNNFLTAPLDRSRIDVKHDSTTIIKSGNANGVLRKRKLWHGVNKTLVYDDDEIGGGEGENFLSARTKRSCGDMYVIDIIAPGIGAVVGDVLQFDPTATLYWHER